MNSHPKIAVEDLLQTMSVQLRQSLNRDPVLVGIHTGGVWIAQRLHSLLGIEEPLNSIGISFYRDDFTRIGLNPEVKATDLHSDLNNRHVLLVDDVLQTGRTVRAALNELFDYGRPASVTLAVLIERNGRELPIQPDVVGMHMDLDRRQQVKLENPDTLSLEIRDAGASIG